MKNLILILLFVHYSNASAQVVREELHKQAVEELLSLNFFKKGRGMVVSPNIIKLYEVLKKQGKLTGESGALHTRWGFNVINNRAVGLFNEPYDGMQMGVLGCVACHSGKAAGRFIVGLGNKNMDVGQVGKDAYFAQLLWGSLPRRESPLFKEIHARALNFTSVLKDKSLNNLTQGLVPTALVKTWFYDEMKIPRPENFGRGQVKIPQLWGYGEKRKVGSFWDGLANGELPGWAVAVELRGGQSPEIVRTYVDKVHHAENLLADLLPPPYPFKINTELASNGKKLFNQTCIKCHGAHERDTENLPVYLAPKHIPWERIKTDKERLSFVTDEFTAIIDQNPLNDLIQRIPREKQGYMAPNLWGIWSRFPYLHNGSVPTLWDLLSEPKDRPVLFSLLRAGEEERYDKELFGLKIERNIESKQYKKLIRLAKKNRRYIYDITRMGHANTGHAFGFYKKFSREDKFALIEYLKTL